VINRIKHRNDSNSNWKGWPYTWRDCFIKGSTKEIL